MVVKLVTDSSSDIPPDIASELDITVVPLYVRFGDEIYRDGPDISADDFYSRLTRDRTRAETSTPSPGDYTNTYNKLAATADGHRLGPPVVAVQQRPERRHTGQGLRYREMRDRGHRF
jgi:DegV family protein with EDD domain